MQIWKKRKRCICINCGTNKQFVIGGCVTLKGCFEHNNESPYYHNLANTYKVKYLTTSLQCYIELSSHIDSLKQNSTPIEFRNWNPIVDGYKGNYSLCCCDKVLHLCNQTSFDMDGQETCIFCGSFKDPRLFFQLQWISNVALDYECVPPVTTTSNRLVAYQCTLVLYFHIPQGYGKAPSFLSLTKTRMRLKINWNHN